MQDMAVLVVDDMRSMRMYVKQVLTDMGFVDIREADSGKAALSVLRRGGVDLVISDIEMPAGDGISLLKKVREDEGLKETPFVMLTAVGDRGRVQEAVAQGVCDYVLKPINPKILERRVRSVINRSSQG